MLILFIILVLLFYAIPSLARLPLVIPGMSLTALFLSSVLAINAFHLQEIGEGITVLSGSFNVTAINLLLGMFMFLLVTLILLGFPKLNKELPYKYNISESIISNYNDYMIIALLSTTGSFLLMSANSLIMIYLAIELQSFGVYLLAAMSKESESSTSAGLKYFLLGSLASCVILLGIALIYSYSGLISLDDIYSLYNVSYNNENILYINIGIGLIATGMLFKIAAAPLHF
jgi:NADH-ubiquinone oxidoreductase chain 2